ncbi:unnamed protein product [Rotaria socialis]|uniref:Uncharacterized protein n=1 Tax=Rotaria socialis TaxID=392032 RepID=A0A817RZL2_9BILA|nr:unnamed protein product [Rotaria socialis]CAF3757096.1 unnamed protein product [Rotaria socialis]CAF4148113.1 unnamed protein product [Rotaria socialis]CAF4495996.1 unnamed protein product [Rotaria socialis]
MAAEADAFMKDFEEKIAGHKLLIDYQWLNDFDNLVHSDCHIVPDTLKYLHYTGYVRSAYNIFVMCALLNDILPVTVAASIPISISLISKDINPSNTIVLGLFAFSQAFFLIMILIVFYVVNEEKRRSEPILDSDKDHQEQCGYFSLLYTNKN